MSEKKIISYDDDVAPRAHTLRVIGYSKTFGAHECMVDSFGGRRFLIDLFTDGTIPQVNPEALIGETISVDYTHGFVLGVWMASNPQIVEDRAESQEAARSAS